MLRPVEGTTYCGGGHLLRKANVLPEATLVSEPTLLPRTRGNGEERPGELSAPQRTRPTFVPKQSAGSSWTGLSAAEECPLVSRGRVFFWPVDQPASLGVILTAPRKCITQAAGTPRESGAVARAIALGRGEFKAKPREERRLPHPAQQQQRGATGF